MPNLPTLNIADITELYGLVLAGLGLMWAIAKAIQLLKSSH